jgi:hypothetical protein
MLLALEAGANSNRGLLALARGIFGISDVMYASVWKKPDGVASATAETHGKRNRATGLRGRMRTADSAG